MIDGVTPLTPSALLLVSGPLNAWAAPPVGENEDAGVMATLVTASAAWVLSGRPPAVKLTLSDVLRSPALWTSSPSTLRKTSIVAPPGTSPAIPNVMLGLALPPPL